MFVCFGNDLLPTLLCRPETSYHISIASTTGNSISLYKLQLTFEPVFNFYLRSLYTPNSAIDGAAVNFSILILTLSPHTGSKRWILMR